MLSQAAPDWTDHDDMVLALEASDFAEGLSEFPAGSAPSPEQDLLASCRFDPYALSAEDAPAPLEAAA